MSGYSQSLPLLYLVQFGYFAAGRQDRKTNRLLVATWHPSFQDVAGALTATGTSQIWCVPGASNWTTRTCRGWMLESQELY